MMYCALTDLTLEQPAPSPLLPSVSNQPQPASRCLATGDLAVKQKQQTFVFWQWSFLVTKQQFHSTCQFAKGLPHSPQQPATPTQMIDIHSNSSSSNTGDNGMKEHGGSNSRYLCISKNFVTMWDDYVCYPVL